MWVGGGVPTQMSQLSLQHTALISAHSPPSAHSPHLCPSLRVPFTLGLGPLAAASHLNHPAPPPSHIPIAALHAPSTMEARPAPPSFCINIDPAREWGAPVAHRGPTVLLTHACLTPQTPEMFVEGWEPPWAPCRADTFTLGKITGFFSSP